MPYDIENKLVVAIASSALFDLSESHKVFLNQGTEVYRQYQREHENDTLGPGVAFPFVRRLLSVNPAGEEPPVEVILLSRNDPDTGLRVMKSIEAHSLPITRAAFLGGSQPYPYIQAFNACLFLSGDEENVQEAVMNKFPAGRVLECDYVDDPNDQELRIAFDFDRVVIDDEAERVYEAGGLEKFQESEVAKALVAHSPGPLKRLLEELGRLHRRELERAAEDESYVPRIKTAIVTARNAPAHQRVVTTLREWGIQVDETFFLGGMEKRRVLEVFKPHIYFDDQLTHLGPTSGTVPSVHVPFIRENVPGE
jgi:5'-nucleotidase